MLKVYISLTLLCTLTLSACGTTSMSDLDTSTPFISSNPTLSKLQGNWGRSASGPAVFKVYGENLIMFKGNKSYPLTLQGTTLVGTITDTRGITCQVALSSAGENLTMGQRNCVDVANSPVALTQANVSFVKVMPKKDYESMSCDQLQTELNQLDATIKQKDSQYQKLKSNNTAWAKEQRNRLLNDSSYTVYRDVSVIGKQKGCAVTTSFDNPNR